MVSPSIPIQNSLDRKSKISEKSKLLLHKFMQQLENIFKKLPKRLEWKSFYVNDFPLVREICEDIRKISLENQLNKSQIKAISEIKKTSPETYQHIVNNTQSSDTQKNEKINQAEKTASIFPLSDMSAREIKQAAEKIRMVYQNHCVNWGTSYLFFVENRYGVPRFLQPFVEEMTFSTRSAI